MDGCGLDRHTDLGVVRRRVPGVAALGAARPQLAAATQGERLESLPPDDAETGGDAEEDEKMLKPFTHGRKSATRTDGADNGDTEPAPGTIDRSA
jgi:hypothetical protein